MVAISLYKGNLHKAPDIPRRWLCPPPNISLKDFRVLLRRRARALSRLRFSNADATTDFAASSKPNRDQTPKPNTECADTDWSRADNAVKGDGGGNQVDNPFSGPELPSTEELKEGEGEKEEGREEGSVKDERLAEGEDFSKKLAEKPDALVENEKNKENLKEKDKPQAPVNSMVEKSDIENAASDVENRIKEVKGKLEILNEKKHSLVQVLKQILNAEEQLKRQNNAQGISGRPPLPLQVDATNDSGSRLNTPRIGSDGNPCGDIEGGEAEDASNHNMHTRQLPRVSSTSPSSDTQQQKPASNMVPLSYRTTLGIAGSPSRFALAGQGQRSVSISGASYIASSPSPATSGGTSVFRDGRLPSPWN